MKKILLLLSVFCCMAISHAQPFQPRQWGDWQTWGEQSDGTFVNPVLPADFSDIDCIGHDGVFYAISSTMQYEPGMVILRSTDMVNWSICSHAVPDISQISRGMTADEMDRYGRGIWAGAIRWHDGLFYVYFGCPDEGMFMTTAPRIEGPWAPLTKMNIPGGWDDCCPLFDDDGRNYFVATHFADGYKTYIFPLSDDGTTVDWDQRVLVNEGYGREANKLYKFDGRYYHLYSEHKDDGRYLMMQRADNPMGPYTEQHRLHYTERQWNEPNQGGYLQDSAGNWFFLTHHGSGDWGGREASLLPVTWIDGWPVIGDPDDHQVGRMVLRHAMPVKARGTRTSPSLRRDGCLRGFAIPDWEWNYHPCDDAFRRTRRSLTLQAVRPLENDNLLKTPDILTVRTWQTPFNEVTVRVSTRAMAEGQRSGLCHLTGHWSEFGVVMEQGRRRLYVREAGDTCRIIADQLPPVIWLRTCWGIDGKARYLYSTNHRTWADIGVLYQQQWAFYRGSRIGLFTYNNQEAKGSATFTRFTYRSHDK